MLLFSTILNINKNMTRESFVKLVINWNKQSTYAGNIIPDLSWDGSFHTRYGTEQLWLAIEEYKPGKIVAIRYEKHELDGSIWDTDYVMNFESMKMCIRLDRSYRTDAIGINPKFSTPHFITLLEEKGYLSADDDLPVIREPIYINDANLDVISRVINQQKFYQIPVVFVSK